MFHLSIRDLAWLLGGGVIALATGILIGREPTLPATLVPVLVVLMLLAVAIQLLYRRRDVANRMKIVRWTMAAFTFHFVVGEVIWHVSGLTDYFGGDAITYHTTAIALSQHWSGVGPMPMLPPGKNGFFYLLAGLYTVLGSHAGAGIAVDAGFGAAMIPLLHDATDRLFGDDAARFVPPLCFFLPGFMIWASQLLRESGIYFGIALTVNAATRLTRRASLGALLMVITGSMFAFLWRSSVGILMGGGILIAMILQRRVRNTAATIVMVGVTAALVVGLGIGHNGLSVVANTSFAQLNGIRSGSATAAASGFLSNSDISSTSHALAYLPLGLPLFMFGPAPWEIHSIRQILAIPDAIVWWALLPSVWRGIGAARRSIHKATLVFVLPAFATALGLSLLIANFGTAVRERMQVIVFLVPLMALGLSRRALKGRRTPATPTDAGSGIGALIPVNSTLAVRRMNRWLGSGTVEEGTVPPGKLT